MNNANNEISFSELRCKEVVNCCDGRRLGKITDIVFSNDSGKIQGIVTPYVKRGMFGKGQEVFIPWKCVKKLGEDVIIVELNSGVEAGRDPACLPPPRREDERCGRAGAPKCDRRCDKCMLFDCEYRWKQ